MFRSLGYYKCKLSTHDLTRRSTYLVSVFYVIDILSTHDLTRRSTLIGVDNLIFDKSFNSRPHTEVDVFAYCKESDLQAFQLTTSHGGRQQIPTIIANICIHYSLFYIKLSFLHYFIFNFRINFLLCGSHIRCESPAILCPLHIRTKELTSQSHQSWALFQYAPLCFYTYLPGYKIADCLLPCL